MPVLLYLLLRHFDRKRHHLFSHALTTTRFHHRVCMPTTVTIECMHRLSVQQDVKLIIIIYHLNNVGAIYNNIISFMHNGILIVANVTSCNFFMVAVKAEML